MRVTEDLSEEDHDQVEEDLFFGFQAHAAELRAKNLDDWECMFFGRHYGVPTRVLDWTDTLGVALYFALEDWDRWPNGNKRDKKDIDPDRSPSIWMINPYALNAVSWKGPELEIPKYLGQVGQTRFADYGEMLSAHREDWEWDHPVAIYPIQLNDRVRAQRGWFTIHGNDRNALEVQLPDQVTQLTLEGKCIDEALQFLDHAGFNRFSIYTDMENLANWVRKENMIWIEKRKHRKP